MGTSIDLMSLGLRGLVLVSSILVLNPTQSRAEQKGAQGDRQINGQSNRATSNDMLVQFNSSKNSVLEVRNALQLSATQEDIQVDVINAREGLARVRFADSESAQYAMLRFGSLKSVESLVPNYLYKPALKLSFVEKELSAPVSAHIGNWWEIVGGILPIVTNLNTVTMPGVLLPPAANPTKSADPLTATDWAFQKVFQGHTGDLFQSDQVIAAVIDTGIDYNHEDLIGAMWRDASDPLIVGWDTVHDTARPYDSVNFDLAGCIKDPSCRSGETQDLYLSNPGHGTHCAGHISAVASNGLGLQGVASGVKVMALKFFYDKGEPNAGSGDDAAAIKAIDFAIAKGVRVINASWGGRMDPSHAEMSALKTAIVRARDAGILFIAAAGNDSLDQDNEAEPDYPAKYDLDNIITVAAIDANDKLADFSNYGATSVHLAAPGVKILSTVPGSKYADIVASVEFNGRKIEPQWDGTSMAAPMVSGAAAYLWVKNPTWTYLEVKEALLSSTRKIPSLTGKVITGGTLDLTKFQ
jgi:thermitase